MSALHQAGHGVRILTNRAVEHEVTEGWRRGVKFVYCTPESLEAALTAEIVSFAPDVVLTQSGWTARTIEVCTRLGTPCAPFIRTVDDPPSWDFARMAPNSPTFVLSNSPLTSQYVRDVWHREPIQVLPTVFRDDCVATHPAADPQTITMINPVKPKGGELFRDIAALLPDCRFRAVRGWKTLRRTGDINSQYVEMGANVEVMGPVDDIRAVYSDTRLLLVPSLWEESFGRVAVEAMMNAIPVIASDRGALPWVVGPGGAIVASRSPADWVRRIRDLTEPNAYAQNRERAALRGDAFEGAAQVGAFIETIRNVLAPLRAVGDPEMDSL